ncbi:sensor histidine kinase [Thermus filiformis]|uniref:histidine kinase n=1 Tax=Thermus filiformis TaxID=276 RepID=A0A0A2XAV8_THEFI|nr:HAMP domain-containing sensor histidine kinase [Thermus filiformis]KGQ22309.1 histidine kinase [Thermus filiformis]
MSLKATLALVIALLAFLPNLILTLFLGGAFPAFLGWLLLLALLSALVGVYLARALLRPLEELTRAVAHLKGRPPQALALPRPKEPPPAEVRLLRGQIEALLEKIRAYDREREAFYAALAHDLKTPLLSSIRVLAYLQKADDLGKEGRLALLKELEKELSRALGLLENLLALSRLEARPVRAETVNLRPLLEDLFLRYQDQAQKRGLSLVLSGSGTARADRWLLERALANLLENALRHAKSRVEVRLFPGRVEVEDDGPGLEAPLEALIQPFLSFGGQRGQAGLGLYTVAQVARAHGGRLETCQGKLGGACFRLELSP